MIKLKEIMFPTQFSKTERESLGSCMLAAEYATKYLLEKGVTNFKVVEGWVELGGDGALFVGLEDGLFHLRDGAAAGGLHTGDRQRPGSDVAELELDGGDVVRHNATP
jgi:hypothetical protein